MTLGTFMSISTLQWKIWIWFNQEGKLRDDENYTNSPNCFHIPLYSFWKPWKGLYRVNVTISKNSGRVFRRNRPTPHAKILAVNGWHYKTQCNYPKARASAAGPLLSGFEGLDALCNKLSFSVAEEPWQTSFKRPKTGFWNFPSAQFWPL